MTSNKTLLFFTDYRSPQACFEGSVQPSFSKPAQRFEPPRVREKHAQPTLFEAKIPGLG
ncbi:hypothetical protein [Microcoleus sp. FACHB-672]|uniref:hypothetical protein n=1 Tax=Microcoleus sp. FACHB-672 TaxID=2692825 RepID=UPI00168331E1|nr:hypothetical protein [Microcoleus sp. FACHB-672]